MAIITIGGNMGAGKSTVAPRLAETLHYQYASMGGVFRMMAKDKGMSIEKFYRSLASDPDLERSVDEEQVELMRENNNIVIQGRNSFFFAKQSGKPSVNIFFAVDPAIGAQRKIDEGLYPDKTLEEVIAIHHAREADERKHYQDLYEIEDYLNRKHYNFIIDTSTMNADEVFQAVFEKIKSKIG